VVTLALPDTSGTIPVAEEMNVELLLTRLHRAMDRLDPKKAVLHLPLPGQPAAPAVQQAEAA